MLDHNTVIVLYLFHSISLAAKRLGCLLFLIPACSGDMYL